MNTVVRKCLASAVSLLAPIGLLVLWLSLRGSLPTRVADHWDLSGHPNGYASPTSLVIWLTVASAVVALLGVAAIWSRHWGRMKSGVIASVAWLLAGSAGDTLLIAVNSEHPLRGESPWWHTLLVLATAACGFGIVQTVVPARAISHADTVLPASSIVLPAGSRTVWFGSAVSRPMWWVGGAGLVIGAVIVALRIPWGFAVLAIGLAFVWCHRVDVRIDASGLTARLGGLPWPRFHTPIDRIVAARVQQIEPMQWGGWGYRLGRRGSAIVMRRGPGIVVARRGEDDLAITVDAPEAGVELLNAYAAAQATEQATGD